MVFHESDVTAIELLAATARRCGVSVLKINGIELTLAPTTGAETPLPETDPKELVFPKMPSDRDFMFAAVDAIDEDLEPANNPNASDATVKSDGEETN